MLDFAFVSKTTPVAFAEQHLHGIKFFSFSHSVLQWVGWGEQEVERRNNHDSWPKMANIHTVWCDTQKEKLRGVGGGNGDINL